MIEYPVNSTAKIYSDADGNDVTLRQLIKLEHEWAHSRIKICEQLEQQLTTITEERDRLREALEKLACLVMGIITAIVMATE